MEELKVYIRQAMLWVFKRNKNATETAKKISSVHGQGVITDYQDTNCTATCLLSRKLFKLDEPDMQDTAGEAGTSSCDVLLWTPPHGRAKAGRPARTYIQQLCEDTGCCPEDLLRAMNDREKWRERVRDIRATSATWWWWSLKRSKFRSADMSLTDE